MYNYYNYNQQQQTPINPYMQQGYRRPVYQQQPQYYRPVQQQQYYYNYAYRPMYQQQSQYYRPVQQQQQAPSPVYTRQASRVVHQTPVQARPQVVAPEPQKAIQTATQTPVYTKPQVVDSKPQPVVQATTQPEKAVVVTPTVTEPVAVDPKVQANAPQVLQEVVEVAPVTEAKKTEPINYTNDLRQKFIENKAVIYAMVPRTFNAKDASGDGLIQKDQGEQSGTFLNAIARLDEMKELGINTFHVLPIHPIGEKEALGTAGSLYAPKNYLQIDPYLDDPTNNLTVKEELKEFTKECHKRGISVMVDLPSCASLDLYAARPDLMAIDAQGKAKTPQGWDDIRMFDPWEDKDARTLNKPLLEMHKKYIDMCVDLGIDGIRADVARAKPPEFWDIITNYARQKDPGFAFLAESYTYEDASPMLNMPYDRPEQLLNAGFDSFYGQFHIFNEWETAKDFHGYMKEILDMSQRLPANKSTIGSFATHDDKSPMSNGGAVYCNMTSAIQLTLPMVNPYILAGYESGDRYIYEYAGKYVENPQSDNHAAYVHPEKMDIFNLSHKPGGKDPEIGKYFSKMVKVRENYEDIITQGSYIPLKVKGNKEDKIISYARHKDGKTLLVIVNKDQNSRQAGKVKVPGLDKVTLKDVTPKYGMKSRYGMVDDNEVRVDLGPGRFHMFEIDTPNIENNVKEVYKQKLDI